MSDLNPKRRFSFSLSTKFILFAIIVEVILVSGGFYTAYTFLSQQRIQQTQSMLASQVSLLAKEVELKKAGPLPFKINQLDLNPRTSFQVLDQDGNVYLDSKNPGRFETRVNGPHPLLDMARNGPDSKKNITFQITLSPEIYYAAYTKVGKYIVLGAIPRKEVYRDTYSMLERFIYLGSLLSGLAVLLIVFFARRIIRPIRRLTLAATQIAGGNFDFELDAPSNDEIGLLASAFSSMSQQVKALLQEEIQKHRIKEEVSNVAQIQQSLLPKPNLKTPRYEIQSYYQSAAETGGDYWGYFELDQYLVVYIADATGHGLTSAMLTVAARGCFSALHRFLSQNPEIVPVPSNFLAYANDAVLESAQEELNMTMFVAVYSYEKKTVTYANAGHNPAWIIRDENGQKRIEVMKGSGVRLGESSVFEAPQDKVVQLGDKDVLFLYTDGLIDCENEENQQYGKNRAKDFLVQAVQNTSDLEKVRQQLVNDVSEFSGNKTLADDITFTLVKPS